MIQTEGSSAIRRIRVLATIVIVLWHCHCPFVPTAWHIYYAPEIGTVASNIFELALGNIMLPTFFMLSGMLYGSKFVELGGVIGCKSILYEIVRRFDRLMIPYALVYTIYRIAFEPRFGNLMVISHLWFLPTLFVCFIVSVLTLKVNRWVMVLASFPLIFLSGKLQGISLGFVTLDFPALYLFYFLLGMALCKHYLKIKAMPWYVVIGIATMYLLFLFTPSLLGRKTVCALTLNFILLTIVPKKGLGTNLKDHIIQLLDRCSFGIYIIHQPVIMLLLQHPMLHRLYPVNPLLSVVLMFIMAFSIATITTITLKKCGFKWI